MTWLCCRWWLCPSRHFSPLLVTRGGGEREIQTANQYSSPETQPLARRVGWSLRRVGWGLRRVGWGLEEGWLGYFLKGTGSRDKNSNIVTKMYNSCSKYEPLLVFVNFEDEPLMSFRLCRLSSG